MKPLKLTAKKEEKIALLGNSIFSEAKLFPYKNPQLVRVPLSVLEARDISLTEAKNLIVAINHFVGNDETFIVFLNGSIFKYKNEVVTMEFTDSLEALEGISLSDEKENLILWIYRTIDLEKRFNDKFFNISELVSKFDKKFSKIIFGNREIHLPSNKNEFNLCRVMFEQEVNDPLDWSVVWNRTEYLDEDFLTEIINKKRLRDTSNLINNRIKKELGVKKNLFSWKGNAISRNF